ncbi:hypothetical protein ACGFT2_00420 [Streptomyces sp. NPDC048514]|uniref:hypothetical protein n=1 Tax=Streptomyces sp. NPDC048514 TaxID=3365564 RepID=UPI00371B5A2F
MHGLRRVSARHHIAPAPVDAEGVREAGVPGRWEAGDGVGLEARVRGGREAGVGWWHAGADAREDGRDESGRFRRGRRAAGRQAARWRRSPVRPLALRGL